MKKLLAFLSGVLSVVLFLSAFAGCGKGNGDISEVPALTLVTTAADRPKLERVAAGFNALGSGFTVRLETLDSESEKNYYFAHGALDADLITFQNVNDANAFEERLQPLNTMEAVGRYQVTIINYLKTSSDVLNVVPAPGLLYTNCFNADAFRSHNFEIPKTFSEFLALVSKMEGYVGAGHACSTLGGDAMMITALMETAFSSFASSTKGIDFLRAYYEGKTTIEKSDYFDEWASIFRNYLSLFRRKYYDVADAQRTAEEGLNDFLSGKTFNFLNTPEIDIYSAIKDAPFETFVVPFAGESESQYWVGSRPRYYLGITKSAYRDERRKAGVDAFLDYYTSYEGQTAASSERDGKLFSDCFSYVKNVPPQLSNAELVEVLKKGKTFLVDTFETVFSLDVEALKLYVTDGLSLNELVARLDSAVLANASQVEKIYPVDKDFDYDKNAVRTAETGIGNFTADAVREIADVAAAVLPSGCIAGNLFASGIKISELKIVWRDTALRTVIIRGEGLKKLVKDKINARGEEGIPLISGIRIEKGAVCSARGREFSDGESLFVLLPEAWLQEYQSYISNAGAAKSLYALLEEYLEKAKAAVLPAPDGRYGGTI